MHKVLDGLRAEYATEIAEARKGVMEVEGHSARADLSSGTMSFDDFWEAADLAAIEDAYRRAARAISPDLARTYSEHLASPKAGTGGHEDALVEAHATVAALGLVAAVRAAAEAKAETLAKRWLDAHRVEIKGLSHDRQDAYRELREMSVEPMDVDLARPTSRMQPTKARGADGVETPLPRRPLHLLADDDGLFPTDSGSSWEDEVLAAELRRPGTVAWYRNPSSASQDSLGVVYGDGAGAKVLRPDFLFFARQADGSIAADIVDPHGTQYGDALPKLRGLARLAEVRSGAFRRVEAVAKVGGKFRVLDLTDPAVRKEVEAASSVDTL